MRRLPRPGVVSAVCFPFIFSFPRFVHERPFLDLPPDVTRGAAYESARDALLQLNVMTRRGMEPDALMYTSLIATMARASLEWQAYKLFSRMLENGVRPLPETYLALRDATAVSRQQLRRELEQKMTASMETFPEELAELELARQREEDRLCVEKFAAYMRGALPPPLEEVLTRPNPEGTSAPPAVEDKAEAVATVHIRHPVDAWSTAQRMEEMRDVDTRRAAGGAAIDLHAALTQMHAEELRIFLAAQRQLRHGDKAELVRRVLKTIGERTIREMLARRRHYFQSVASILENDLRALGGEEKPDHAPHERTETASPPALNPAPHANTIKEDHTCTATEQNALLPDVLHTPWGILRKPMRSRQNPPAPRSASRLERIALSPDALQLIRTKATAKALDELPEGLLRRYAFEFRLTWKRAHPLSLLEAVQWHVTTFFAARIGDEVAVHPTPSLRRQGETEGMGRTLENYEAFRIIAQRTNNLQVVDHKEINLHLKRVRREALRRERRAEETIRREGNLLDAVTLAASAKTFDAETDETTANGATHVLGLDTPKHGTDNNKHDEETDNEEEEKKKDSDEMSKGELPPWAVCAGEEEFNITTGRFGDPNIGRYQELSDGRFKVLPSREAQNHWGLDRHLLPGELQDELRRAELKQTAREDTMEKEYTRRLQFHRYRKWDAFLRKAQRKKSDERRKEEEEEEEKANGNAKVKPLGPKRRLSTLLRKGKDKAPVNAALRAKYNKSL